MLEKTSCEPTAPKKPWSTPRVILAALTKDTTKPFMQFEYRSSGGEYFGPS